MKGGDKVESSLVLERMAKKMNIPLHNLLKKGAEAVLKEKKRKYLNERLEILLRYEAITTKELKEKIKEGIVSEHPAWEDFIEAKNIENEVKEIENDLKSIQET